MHSSETADTAAVFSEAGVSVADRLRQRFSDGQRFLLLCFAAGASCGLAAVAFHLTIHWLFESLWHFAQGWNVAGFCAVLLVAPAFAGLLVGLTVRFVSPEAAGSGIPQTKLAYYNHGGRVSTRAGICRFALGALYVGLGNSLGREGPTVHVSAAISSRIGRWAFRNPARVQAMLPVGVAAGIAAAFNAPLSALTFVFEELLDNFSMKALGGMVVAVVVAAAISRGILGEEPILPAKIFQDFKTSPWMLVALPIGLMAGLCGQLFTSSILKLRQWFSLRLLGGGWLNPAIGGLACGTLALAAYGLTEQLGDPRSSVFSIGYDSLQAAFESKLGFGVLAALLVFKFLAVVVAYSSGGSGGLFSPTLFLGGMLGGLAGILLTFTAHHGSWLTPLPPDARIIGGCVLLGMGALFAAVIRCPITSLLIIFEMTGNYSLILPLMAGNMLAWQIARKLRPVGIYDSLLVQDGVTLRKLPSYRGSEDFSQLPVQAIMCCDVFALYASEPPAAALHRAAAACSEYHAYPVLGTDGNLSGVVTCSELQCHRDASAISEITAGRAVFTLTTDLPIRTAMQRMAEANLAHVPVVIAARPGKVVGWLTMNDIVRQANARGE
jgi:chloride channel protein, CIC family